MKLDARQAECVNRLRSNPDFAVLLEAMDAYANGCVENSIFCSDSTKADWMRGMARAAIEIMRAIDSAKDIPKAA